MTKHTPNVVCFGEVLWDTYPDRKHPGGAPFNVSVHLNRLGISADLITRVGADALGVELISELQRLGVPERGVQTDTDLPTGVVKVRLNGRGIPSYEIRQPAAWDAIQVNEQNLQMVRQADAFVFGSLACRSMVTKSSLIELAGHSRLSICDLNIRQTFYSEELIVQLLSIADILKVNDEELVLIGAILDSAKDELLKKLQHEFEIDVIIETKGKDGASAFKGGRTTNVSGFRVEPVDTVGSGDAFLAQFIARYLHNHPIEDCLREACRLGAYVATQPGAIPEQDRS